VDPRIKWFSYKTEKKNGIENKNKMGKIIIYLFDIEMLFRY